MALAHAAPLTRAECLERMARTDSVEEQMALRSRLQSDDVYLDIIRVYLANPFFRLTDEEVEHFRKDPRPSPLWRLIESRHAASSNTAAKYAVFCMPKSGSSFVQNALHNALELPVVSLTSFGRPRAASLLGMNSREQELDELAIIKAIIRHPEGFISQNHTRCSLYLASQMKFFGITPILTVRNVLDCIVSFDDMMLAWRARGGDLGWTSDAQFSLPRNYPELDADRRYEILAASYGVWLIGFYLSWKRCIGQNAVSPLVIRYEDEVLDSRRFVQTIASQIPLPDAGLDRLTRYVHSPDRARTRFNVGVKGRGRDRIPEATQRTLLDYAHNFRDELSEDDISYLVR